MKAALIDNGSIEPAAHRNLRRLAAEVGERAGMSVEAVSCKHSDRIPAVELDGRRAWTLARWVRSGVADGEREFVFIPFFVSPQGAVGSALRADLEALALETGGLEFSFTEGLSDGLAAIAADRILEVMAARGLNRPAVVVVDHGGPAAESANIRNRVAEEIRRILGDGIGPLFAASMESPEGPGFAFNRPLFSEILSSPALAGGDTVVAPLFLAPGRHAGPDGDLARLARAAEARRAGLRCHFAGLVGTHPRVPEVISGHLRAALLASELQLETP
jgi:sirohydrochlorin ferrochelatase